MEGPSKACECTGPQVSEFGPMTPDDKPQGYGSYFLQLFKRNKAKSQTTDTSKYAENKEESVVIQGNGIPVIPFEGTFEQSSSSNSLKNLNNETSSNHMVKSATPPTMEEVSLERTLPNVLTRIKNIIDKRGAYKDADFKHYWLPDHLSKECYDCSEKFTPLRRRHHCRVCGQIFCSKCCNRMIPGKVIGYKGDLRVCTYCCKVVLTYLQSNNIEEDVLADLKALQEELLPPTSSALSIDMESSSVPDLDRQASAHRRKPVFGFMEENYTIKSRYFSSDFVDRKQLEQMSSERQLLLKDSQQLQSLWHEMVLGPKRLPLSTNRHRLKAFPNSFIGRDFVQWLLDNDKASSRQSAIAIGQALLEAGFIFCVSQTHQVFVDEHVLYNTPKPTELDIQAAAADCLVVSQDLGQEPLWLKQIPSQVEDDPEESTLLKYAQTAKGSDYFVDISGSSSTYSLDLNFTDSIVSMRNPLQKSVLNIDGSGVKRTLFGVDMGDSMQTSVSAVLNDSILSSDSEQHSTGTVMAEEVLEALKTLEPKAAEARAAGWQQLNQMIENEEAEEGQLDEQTRMSLMMQKQFNDIWSGHENALLTQLLRYSDLDLSWGKTMLPLIYKVVDTVRPDVRNESDDMDIRQYVQFKKVPGGTRSECRIINGTVCTKNVVHRHMKTRLTDPQILLIASYIDYHRSVRNRQDLTIDNVLMQEEDYIKKVVAKILSYSPDIVITGEGISYIAREYLMREGLTLIMNVKSSVLERIARCTQAQIIPMVDPDAPQLCDIPPHRVLGMCHSFYLRPFVLPSQAPPIPATAPPPKTLMFFDGCATHLACTIILRGAPNRELKRVKRVMYFMIFALFNWRLERSFLMDEFASVPTPLPDDDKKAGTEEGADATEDLSETKVEHEEEMSKDEVETRPENEEGEKTEGESTSVLSSSTFVVSKEANVVVDESDPLCAYLRRGSAAVDLPTPPLDRDEKVEGSALDLPSFEAALQDTVLSVSPHIRYAIPYLESNEGNNSPLRKFFPEKLYFSSLVRGCLENAKRIGVSSVSDGGGAVSPSKTDRRIRNTCCSISVKPCHSFITGKITKGASDLSLRNNLADFRARGGTIHRVCQCEMEKADEGDEVSGRDLEDDTGCDKKESYNNFVLTPDGKIDALHPYNHQRIALLFFSFSHTFQYTSVFCVNPRVLTMDFYGRNDIPLGAFLERYCFSPSYRCLSDACQTPSLRHIRKFVHENGCVEILLRKMDTSFDDSNSVTIYMWSWCKECREVSPVVPMSADTWLFSFAKYLELRFRETSMSRRGTPGCSHSIHQNHFHYFGQKDLVAVIKYLTIPTRELVIPPAEIEYIPDTVPQSTIVDMIKAVAIQGYNVFSTIVDRLSTISDEIGQRWDPLLKEVSSHHHQQKQVFKESIEKIQLQLTSPSLEQRWLDAASSSSSALELATVMYGICDQVTIVKRLIAQVVIDWNSKVQDLINLRKKEEKERFRNNSGNLLKQSSGPQFSAASPLTGSVEQLSVSSKASEEASSAAVAPLSQTASCEHSSESTPEGEKFQSCTDEQRKSTSSISTQGSTSNPSLAPTASEDENGGTMSGQTDAAPLPPLGCNNQSLNAGAEKDINDEAEASHQSEESSRLRQISTSSEAVSSNLLRSGLPQQPFKSSPKSFHERSLSDEGEVVLAKEAASEKIPEKRYSSSVKNIISTLWSSSADLMVKSPFDASEHFALLPEVKIPVVIYDDEPSSIIAKALASQEYEVQLHNLQKKMKETTYSCESSTSGVSNNRTKEGQGVAATSSMPDNSNPPEGDLGTSPSKMPEGEKTLQKDFHIDLQWSDQHANYYCKILFVEQFRKLRQLIFPFGEEFFIRSLSRCVIWDARGGKSGSFFCKTADDRFILKELSRFENASFLEFAPSYIQYMTDCKKENKPTALTRIVGVYRVGFKNSTTNKAMKLDLLVMENLFYRRCIGPKFDLKGSVRNRKVNITGKEESEVVLLDENLLQMVCSSPFYLRPHGKAVLTRAIAADSAFLAHQLIMDYSLLVGVDETNNQLIVGIIDYIRTFTLDKKFETILKGSVLGAGTGKLPTVIPPESYRNRFCHAMKSYFVVAPDRWSGLGLSFDS